MQTRGQMNLYNRQQATAGENSVLKVLLAEFLNIDVRCDQVTVKGQLHGCEVDNSPLFVHGVRYLMPEAGIVTSLARDLALGASRMM